MWRARTGVKEYPVDALTVARALGQALVAAADAFTAQPSKVGAVELRGYQPIQLTFAIEDAWRRAHPRKGRS